MTADKPVEPKPAEPEPTTAKEPEAGPVEPKSAEPTTVPDTKLGLSATTYGPLEDQPAHAPLDTPATPPIPAEPVAANKPTVPKPKDAAVASDPPAA